MNTLSLDEVMKYSHQLTDILLLLNKLKQEAYEAGVKDIEIFVTRKHYTPGEFPMVIGS